MAKTYNLTIEQGSSFFLSISMENDEGYVLNIKECLAIMQIRALHSHSSEILFDVTPYMTFTADNRIIIEIPGATTSAIGWTEGFYDIRIKEEHTMRIYKILEGGAKVIPRVSDNKWDRAARWEDDCILPDDI
jgi:hypothetical protein